MKINSQLSTQGTASIWFVNTISLETGWPYISASECCFCRLDHSFNFRWWRWWRCDERDLFSARVEDVCPHRAFGSILYQRPIHSIYKGTDTSQCTVDIGGVVMEVTIKYANFRYKRPQSPPYMISVSLDRIVAVLVVAFQRKPVQEDNTCVRTSEWSLKGMRYLIFYFDTTPKKWRNECVLKLR